MIEIEIYSNRFSDNQEVNILHNIMRLRTSQGITQNELARKSGVKQSVISDIENGKTSFPRVDTLSKIATALGCTVDDLLDKQDAV